MPEAAETETPRQTYLWRGLRRYVRLKPRSIIPERTILHGSAVDVAFRAAVPWKKKDYPGQLNAWRELLGRPVANRTIFYWMSGRNGLPDWAAAKLLAFLRSRVAAMTAAIEALEADGALAAKRGRGPGGLQKIDPVTGLDGRNRTGRRGKVKEV